MTAILPSPSSDPFNTTPSPATCRLGKPFSFPYTTPDLDSASLDSVTYENSRQLSPASVLSVASVSPLRNDENLSFLARLDHRPLTCQSIPASRPDESLNLCNRGRRPLSFIADEDDYDPALRHDETAWSDDLEVDGDAVVVSEPSLRRLSMKINHPFTPAPSPRALQDELEPYTHDKSKTVNYHIKLVTPESELISRTRESRQQSSSKESGIIANTSMNRQQLVHHQRLSDSSSGFIHSMKTASVTNASFSVAARSSRVGRSTDSYVRLSTQGRYSIDSDRPLSGNLSDDAALRRGFKRQQIIDELITTEENYISDLKALVYLYSTLLASSSSIPNRVRVSIERNVTGILHTHEAILANFHDARLRAAARRWADTEIPAKLANQGRSHSQLASGNTHLRTLFSHRRFRSSIDSVEAFTPHLRHSGSAEPIDVFEIASILKAAVRDFYAYEEYCANFEIIGREFAKHNPHVWSTYESGMESLAKVVMTIDQRQVNDRRGLTVSDLLIKPIQRLTKYPLLLEQLLNNTPLSDSPGTHVEIEIVLQSVRDVLQMVNLARENPYTRHQIQKRWLLQDRLEYSRLGVTQEQLRSLGSVVLCGVLHITYQTSVAISGQYALCVLFDEHFLVASPVGTTGRFEIMALIQLSDIRVETPTDGKGLQCAATLFTWKLSFACDRSYHELILSGCSKIEEDQWMAGLRGDLCDPIHCAVDADGSVATCMVFDLRSVGVVFSSQKSLSRESSVQRAATVGSRPSISHVIVQNTHNAHDVHGYREFTSTPSSIIRSQSQIHTKRPTHLRPKKAERIRLESSISDIWTKERLPFPGMVGPRGQRIRESAGSLARRLSLASIHSTFSKGRTSSLSVASKKSNDLINESKLTFGILRQEYESNHGLRPVTRDIPEVDDMRSVVGRMMGGSMPVPRTDASLSEPILTVSRSKKLHKASVRSLGLHDPAAIFYEASARLPNSEGDVSGSADTVSVVGNDGPKRRKKRWSRHWPIEKLKEFSSEAIGMFHSSSSGS